MDKKIRFGKSIDERRSKPTFFEFAKLSSLSLLAITGHFVVFTEIRMRVSPGIKHHTRVERVDLMPGLLVGQRLVVRPFISIRDV